MEAIVPYLTFPGNAAEAMEFYAKALKGEIVMSQTFGESPMESKPEDAGKIMHAVLKVGPLMIMASDANEAFPVQNGNSISLSLNFTDEQSIEETFTALSEGATITMLLQDTFWGAKFGMLTDKFGMAWMFNHDKEPQEN